MIYPCKGRERDFPFSALGHMAGYKCNNVSNVTNARIHHYTATLPFIALFLIT